MTTMSRRSILARASAAAAIAAGHATVAPALTTALGNADPILAAIDAHQAAMRAFSDALTEQEKLYEELPRERRQSVINASDGRLFETDDPRWIANQRAVDQAGDEVFEGALALLDVRPTTVAGMVTLFRYVASAEEADLPENVLLDGQDDSDDGVNFQTALLLTAAEWLEKAGSLRA